MFDYEKFGDSPACLGDDTLDLVGKIGVNEGFGRNEDDESGVLLQTNNTIISNEECYEKLSELIENDESTYNRRSTIHNTVYDGITSQILCTQGIEVEKCFPARPGRKAFCKTFYSVRIRTQNFVFPTTKSHSFESASRALEDSLLKNEATLSHFGRIGCTG